MSLSEKALKVIRESFTVIGESFKFYRGSVSSPFFMVNRSFHNIPGNYL